jgi:hypothetical protein
MKIILNKKIIILSVLILFLFSNIAFAVWDGFLYDPGETNNPECLPSQVDCDVSPAVTISQSTPQTIGLTGTRLSKLWATDLDVTNTITGNISGNSGTVTNGVYTNIANSMSLINPLTTLPESWIGPSSTTGIYFKGGNVGIGNTSPSQGLEIGSNTTGLNSKINATLSANNAPALVTPNYTLGAGWSYGTSPDRIEKLIDGTGTVTPVTQAIVIGTTYKVTITVGSLSGSTMTWTLGGVTGTPLIAATTYTEYITALSTGKLIITPVATGLRASLTVISVEPLVDATGDLDVEGNLAVGSAIKSIGGTDAIFISREGRIGFGSPYSYYTDGGYKFSFSGGIYGSSNIVIAGSLNAVQANINIPNTLTTPVAGYQTIATSNTSGTIPIRISPSYLAYSQAWDGSASRYNSMGWHVKPTAGSPTSARIVFHNFTINGVSDTTELGTIGSNGNWGIGGITNPTAWLELGAGTASKAPLKLTSGTLLTTPEVGAIEFNNDAYYGTITTGGARKTFAFLESPVFTTNITTPLIIGGTDVGSNIIYKSTTGAGTATGIAHQFVGGTDGGTVISTMLNNGNVGIGTTSPTAMLDMPANNTTEANARFGTFGIQSYATNNGWLSDNSYYNGTSFLYRANGYATRLYFLGGIFKVGVASSGTAGGVVSYLDSLTVVKNPGSLPAVGAGTGTFGTYTNFQVNNNATADNLASTQLNAYNSSVKPLVIQGAVSQAVNLTEWQNSSGTALAVVDKSGNFGIGTTTPTSRLQVTQGTAGVGTVSTPGSSTTLTGVGTQFTNTFKVGDTLTVAGETVRTIATITSDTVLDVSVAFSVTARSAVAYTLTGGTRFSVLGNGNVGIGTTAPVTPLEIPGSTTNSSAKFGAYELQSYSVNNSWLGENTYYDGANYKYRATGYANLLKFFTGGISFQTAPSGTAGNTATMTEKMRLSNAGGLSLGNAYVTTDAGAGNMIITGNVGIGTTTPTTNKLVVVGDIRVGTSGTNGCIEQFAGTALVGSCSSDINLKTNISPINGILDTFLKLQPVTYQWRVDEFPDRHFGNELVKGLVAQDVELLFPELVDIDGRGFKTVDYGIALQMLSIEAIKELDLKIIDINNFEKENTWRDNLVAWLANAENRITRIFTGEVCLTDVGEEAVCLNRTELKSLKALINQSVVNPNPTSESIPTEIIPEPIPTPSPTSEATSMPAEAIEVLLETAPTPADSENSNEVITAPTPIETQTEASVETPTPEIVINPDVIPL